MEVAEVVEVVEGRGQVEPALSQNTIEQVLEKN